MTQPSEEKTELALQPKLLAAGWFAATACIPILAFFGIIGRIFFITLSTAADPTVASLFIAVPVSIATFLGFVIGSRILNDAIVIRSRSAAIYGAVVAILSYFGFMLTYTVILLANMPKQIGEVMGSMLKVFAIGAILVGWLIILAGAFSGWLLFRFSRKSLRAPVSTWTTKSTAQRLNYWAVVVLVVVLVICWLPVRKFAQREKAEEARRDLIDAVQQNRPTRVEELLASGLEVDTQDVAGSTLLLIAAEEGGTRIVRMLLDRGANPNVSTDRYGHRTPLHWAASNFDIESIKALLDHGANVNAPDDYGHTPLMVAASMTDRDTVKFLIERGANVNCKARDGSTPLSLARRDRDSAGNRDRSGETGGKRLDAGKNFGDSRDYQNPAIIKRARDRHDAIIELLKSYGAK